MNEVTDNKKIENLIYKIRGKEVMLDSDLARLYECKNGTKEINQAVKNNIDKFPERYCFKLSKEEYTNLKSKLLTSSLINYGGVRKMPHVFTEQGVYMLATILKSKKASTMTLYIMDAFVAMKKYISNELLDNSNVLLNLESRVLKLEKSFDKFKEKQTTIIYEGKIYDAVSALLNILQSSKKEIIIIDNFVDNKMLNLLRNIDRKIIILSKNINNELYKKYSKEYNNITFIENNPFHDRYIILDKKEVYITGMSLKDMGKSYSYIYKINEDIFLKELLKRINAVYC